VTSLAISGVFHEQQLAGGAYSCFENLLRGLVELRQSPNFGDNLDLTVFHGGAGLRWQSDQISFRGVSDRLGRFAAESLVGAYYAACMDAVLFRAYFTPPIVRASRTVTIIHDLQFLHMPEFYTRKKLTWLKLSHQWTLRKCDAVITISQAVKDDLLTQFGSRWADRIHVIWNPVSLERFDSTERRDFSGGRPYILCVAMDRPQKNLYTLVRAFDRLKDRFPDHCLVMAGQLRSLRNVRHHQSGRFAKQMPSTVDLVADLGLEDRVIVTGFVSDAELGALYRDASLFVLPSIFEGFGMPAVESIAMGAPTVVSDLPVLREVTLNSANYIRDPQNVDEFADVMAYALANENRVRPSPDAVAELRRRVAPPTIARQYVDILQKP
jgi:glycosyltransferase involved in cell wall biosynthesis